MSALTDAIQQAIANPPRFYPGDRVQVRGNIEGQNHATVISGGNDRYLIALDHKRYIGVDGDTRQIKQWCDGKSLTRLEACTCGSAAAEGERH